MLSSRLAPLVESAPRAAAGHRADVVWRMGGRCSHSKLSDSCDGVMSVRLSAHQRRWASSFFSKPSRTPAAPHPTPAPRAPSVDVDTLRFLPEEDRRPAPFLRSSQRLSEGHDEADADDDAVQRPLLGAVQPQPAAPARQRRRFARPMLEEEHSQPSAAPLVLAAQGSAPAHTQARPAHDTPGDGGGGPREDPSDVEARVVQALLQEGFTRPEVFAETRLQAARERHTVTDDDPVMNIAPRSVADADVDEAAATHQAAVRDRAAVSGDMAAAVAEEPRVAIDQLSEEQKTLLWKQRTADYSVLHRRILIALESHHALMDKALLVIELHDQMIKQRLRLRAEVYQDMVATIFAAVTAPTHLTSNNRRRVTLADEVWCLYQYCVDSGTDPTPALIQNVMRVLALGREANMEAEARAHRLMLDSDRFKLIPTNFCLTAYFLVCRANNAMHMAVGRYVDARTRHEVIPSASMVLGLIDGLRANGQADRAVSFIATLSNVPITADLLHAVIHAACESSTPLAAFAFYKSLLTADVRPDLRIISTLVVAQERADDYSNTAFILQEMLKHRVRCATDALNRLLAAFVRTDMRRAFAKVVVSMRRNGRQVYWERFPQDWIDEADALDRRMRAAALENDTARRSRDRRPARREQAAGRAGSRAGTEADQPLEGGARGYARGPSLMPSRSDKGRSMNNPRRDKDRGPRTAFSPSQQQKPNREDFTIHADRQAAISKWRSSQREAAAGPV